MKEEKTIQKRQLLKSVSVDKYDHSSKWYSKAVLNVGEFEVVLKTMKFDTMDEAVASIKERISEAVKTKLGSAIVNLKSIDVKF